jgi:hypothetical protein
MSKFFSKTHVCLVSSQPIPNLVAAFNVRTKPSKVVLVGNDRMIQEIEGLETVFAGRKIETERWHIPSPYDYDHVRLRLEKLLARPGMDEVALNVTGGTKIMALAAFELFRERGLPIFFVQPDKDLFLPLHPTAPPLEISDCLTLEEFLAAHGFQVTSLRRRAIDPARGQLGQRLVNHTAQFGSALGALNYLAGTAEDRYNLVSDPVSSRHWSQKGFSTMLDLLTTEGIVRQEQDRLCFQSEGDRFFVNGGWLEEYLYSRVARLQTRMPLQDAAMSVQVESSSGSRNEIDLAILVNNRLHLIECKTRNFTDGQGAGARTLYKMDMLRDLGGFTSRAMLVSYKKLGFYDARRAADLDIEVVAGTGLRGIEGKLEKWLTT